MAVTMLHQAVITAQRPKDRIAVHSSLPILPRQILHPPFHADRRRFPHPDMRPEHPIPDPVDAVRDRTDRCLVVDTQMELVLQETVDLEQQLP